MTETFNKLAIAQFNLLATEALKKHKSGIELPENLGDLMYETMCERVGEPVQLVSVRDIICCEIPLPFLPNLIDYKIGKGCCDEIVAKKDGLLTPCSKHCDGKKCAKHLETRSGCGDYWDRYAAWEKKEPYCVVIGDKEIKERSYGSYLHSKSLDSTAVAEELKKWGIQLRLDPELFRTPIKPPKKSRGRKTELKVESTESDEESEPEEPESEPDEANEEPKEEPKKPEEEPAETKEEPKKKPTPKPRAKKALGTPLDGDLVKEEMEERAPKKGKFKGKPENLKDAEHDGTAYKTNAGKYYNTETLELVAWTHKGEFTPI